MDIPVSVCFGSDLKIEYMVGIVINPKVIIGKIVIVIIELQLEKKKGEPEGDSYYWR